MKKSIILSMVATATLLVSCNNDSNKQHNMESTGMHSNESSQNYQLDTSKLNSGDSFYQCEMDLDVISDKAGNCPKCEMALTEHQKN